MATEQSIFHTEEMINDFLTTHYGLQAISIQKVDLGSANCFKIVSDRGVYFLKEFQSKFSVEMIKREIDACEILQPIIPTSQFIKNKQGHVISEESGRILHLQKYIEGTVYNQNSYDQPQLDQEAIILAKIHQGLENKINLPDGFPDGWFTVWTKDNSIRKYKKICAQHEAIRTRELFADRIITACEKKVKMLTEYSADVTKFMKLSKVNSHGDFNNLQIIFDNHKRIAAVVDFSSVTYLPAVWEIIRSYTYSAKECVNGDCIDLVSLKKYIDAYLSIRSLPLFDVVHMAEFYFYNLLRSSYGLDATEENISEFGLWRTQLCSYLSNNYKIIGEFMYNTYAGTLK